LVLASAILAVVGLAAIDAVWVGDASIPLQFVILDASTGRPIKGATIRLINEPTPESEYEAADDPAGRAEIVVHAMVSGRSSWFRGTRSVNYKWLLDVAADGYDGLSADLRRFTRDPAYHYNTAPPPIVIRLAPMLPGRSLAAESDRETPASASDSDPK
jgi:hypothetical protein